MREPVDYSAGHSRDIFCQPYIILINNGFGWLETIKASGCRGAVGAHLRTKHQRTYLQGRSRIIPGHHINGITARPYKNRRHLDALLEKFHATESDAEDLSALGPQIQGVDCAVTMRELGDGVWKFSLRTGERVNATEVCRLLGGGGHARAAGATVEHVTQAEAEEKMLSAIAQIVPDFKK